MDWTGKIIVFTDIHITGDGSKIVELDPLERFRTALAHALDNHGDADCVVITGDLADTADTQAYQLLAEAIADVDIPVHLLLGNHDQRRPFQSVFPDAMNAGGFVQGAAQVGDTHLLFLDTLCDPAPQDHHAGELCAEKRKWLTENLAARAGEEIIVFAHHPPFMSGFDAMDGIALTDGDWLIDTLVAANVRLFVTGHVHRWMSGVIRGLPWVLFKSPAHQQPMELGPADIFASVEEGGGYGLLLLGPEQVVAHMVDVF